MPPGLTREAEWCSEGFLRAFRYVRCSGGMRVWEVSRPLAVAHNGPLRRQSAVSLRSHLTSSHAASAS